MRNHFLLPIFQLLLCCGSVRGAVESPELKAAESAMRDHLPEVAMTKLERLLATPKLDAGLAAQARTRLAEACVRAEKWDRALEITAGAKAQSQPEMAFWRAMALQSLGRWSEALEVSAALPTDPAWPWFREATYNRVAILSAVGDFAEAEKVLAPLLKDASAVHPHLWQAELLIRQKRWSEAEAALQVLTTRDSAEQSEQAFLWGRLRLEQENYPEAISHFAPLVQPEMKLPRALHQTTLYLLARAQRLAGERIAAVTSLATLVAETPEAELLGATFEEFQRCNTPPDAEMIRLLLAWRGSNDAQTKALATLALVTAKEASGDLAEALRLCQEFIASQPESPLMTQVLLRQSRLLIQQGQVQQALLLFKPLQEPQQPASVRAFAAAMLAYAEVRAEDFHRAAEAFKLVSETTADPEKQLVATFQAALASVSAKEPEVGAMLLAALPAAKAKPLQVDYLLERGLYAAGQGAAEATTLLQQFLDQQSQHPRAFAAALALAEISLQNIVSAPQTVRERIAVAQGWAKTPEDLQRVEILTLHLESLNATPEAFAKKADQFLSAHPESVLRADLLMKIAVRFYNTQQYAPAKARFLQIVEEEPESSLVETSLFWAGKAALGLGKGCEDEAIKLWDRVAAGKGMMQMDAKLEQAKLNQRRNPPAALQIFETILKATPPPNANLRYTVLCLRGETLMATAGEDAAKWQEALNGFDQVIQSPEASVYWKQQAYVRKGGCLENLKQDAAALEAYHEAMNLSRNNNSPNEADYHWFFRAGGKAIRLLESKKNWEAAVAIAQKLAEAPGPQADAARERASRITTEHFLWQDE